MLNFHSSDDSYYEDWREQVEDATGWVVILNMPAQSQYDFVQARLNKYIELVDFAQWRTLKPELVFQQLDDLMLKRLE